ncbi:MAG: MATE family efflux transporter [Oscillospiraceae bacterium]|nr:MATE family efflux transporter [Oscillospiraceae bacterium]
MSVRDSLAVLWDRSFLTKLWAIAIPVAVQNLINFGVTAADTIMVGRLGEVQLSAVWASNQLTFLYMVTAFGVAGGCGVLAAQYWGAGNRQRVQEIMGFMFRLTTIVTLLFATLAFFFPAQVLGFITYDADVIAEGVPYLRIMSVGYLFFGFTTAGLAVLRSTGTVKIAVVASSVTLVISVVLNYGLIFGNFGLPELGVPGAAIATSTARVVEFTLLCIYLFRVEKRIAFRPIQLLRWRVGVARPFFSHSSPVLVSELGWAMANFMVGVIIGQMGREFMAANTIATLLIQFVGVAILGLASAAATMVGNSIGAGERDRAIQYANGMLALSFFAGIAGFLAVQALRLPLIGLYEYEFSEAALEYARQITHVLSVITIFHAVAIVAILGTLRGGGDTKFAMVTDIIFAWLIAIPLGAIAGLWLQWPVVLVYLVLRSEDLFKAVVVLWRIPSGKWLKDVRER